MLAYRGGEKYRLWRGAGVFFSDTYIDTWLFPSKHIDTLIFPRSLSSAMLSACASLPPVTVLFSPSREFQPVATEVLSYNILPSPSSFCVPTQVSVDKNFTSIETFRSCQPCTSVFIKYKHCIFVSTVQYNEISSFRFFKAQIASMDWYKKISRTSIPK